MPSNFTTATNLLAARMQKEGKYTAFDPSVLLSFLLTFIGQLMQCKPTPQSAYDHLTWKPSPRWWDFLPWARSVAERLWDHRNDIQTAAYAQWTKSVGEFRALWWTIWQSIDAGDLTPDLMAGMYAERKGQ